MKPDLPFPAAALPLPQGKTNDSTHFPGRLTSGTGTSLRDSRDGGRKTLKKPLPDFQGRPFCRQTDRHDLAPEAYEDPAFHGAAGRQQRTWDTHWRARKGPGTPATDEAVLGKHLRQGYRDRLCCSPPARRKEPYRHILPDMLSALPHKLTAVEKTELTGYERADPNFMQGSEAMYMAAGTEAKHASEGTKACSPSSGGKSTNAPCSSPVYEGQENFIAATGDVPFSMWKNEPFLLEGRKPLEP